jgi:hypothetical protein
VFRRTLSTIVDNCVCLSVYVCVSLCSRVCSEYIRLCVRAVYVCFVHIRLCVRVEASQCDCVWSRVLVKKLLDGVVFFSYMKFL